ncbi:ribosome biogenesis protein NOP53 [Sporobolomyces salmoneus]|uniref:ribosome biogenesis protein NOP53 n=1 Tax=Sporobolomyces salmoneus TaxID=183962 RepID=UPI00316E5B87
MPKASRANSKKSAPSSKKLQQAVEASKPLFEIDTQGSSSVRRTLLANQQPAQARLRKGQSIHKPLRSDLILAQRSDVPALSSRVVPSLEAQAKKNKVKLGNIDRKTKEKLKKLAGRDGQGEGLWGIKGETNQQALSDAVKAAGGYDAWKEKEKPSEEEDTAMKEFLAIHDNKNKPVPKAPATLHSHQMLEGNSHRSISIPHPGTSYNPSHEHHQALLSSALDRYTTEEAREERGQDVKDLMDEARVNQRGKEVWQAYEEEVGSGEEDNAEEVAGGEDGDADKLKKKLPKRKTRQQRNSKLRVAEEARQLALRREMKKRIAAVHNVKSVQQEIVDEEKLSLEEKAIALKMRKARLAEQGLTRFRSGPSRVPDAPVNFQLGDELADNLRTLQPEGNLWKEWVASGMRRGKVPVERANESKKGGKRGGRGRDKGSKMKEVEKYSYKNWTG